MSFWVKLYSVGKIDIYKLLQFRQLFQMKKLGYTSIEYKIIWEKHLAEAPEKGRR